MRNSVSTNGWFRLGTFLAFVISAGACLLLSAHLENHGWFDGLALIFAVASTIMALGGELPLQNVFMAAALVALVSGLVETIGVATGIPFGSFTYTDHLGPRIFGALPWPVPLLWTVIVLNSRQIARLILRGWPELPARGFWTIGIASLLAVAVDFGLEPFASSVRDYWRWPTPASSFAWHGVSWVNFLGWMVVACLILIAITPWMIDKRPGTNLRPNLYPLWLWLAVLLSLSAANSSRGLWDSAIAGLMVAVVVLLLGLGGARA